MVEKDFVPARALEQKTLYENHARRVIALWYVEIICSAKKFIAPPQSVLSRV